MSLPDPREEAVFEAALQLPVEQRTAYLDETCAGDAGLRSRVEALLGAFERARTFLNRPAAPGRTERASLLPTEKPGDHIGRYKLLQQIGEGGMGVVYMAEQTEPVVRKVALKIIKLGMDTRSVVARFEAERQALALMDHPNIAKVFDAGATDSGRPFFVMELVRGVPITEYCDQNHLPARARLELFIAVCQAVQHAHGKGIIHRDLKPSNVLVTLNDGVPHPMVIDFGIAKATHQKLTDKTLFTHFAQLIGTPAYMSPEQAELSRLEVDRRSDIYSLGVLLYELLTGRTPFDQQELLAAGLEAMRRVIRETEPPKPSTRLGTMQDAERALVARNRGLEPVALERLFKGDLDWVVMKCLEKDRTRRYDTAQGLAADLTRHLQDETVVARPPSAGYRLQKFVRRHPVGLAVAAVIAVLLTVGITLTSWQARRAQRAERANRVAQFAAEQARQTALAEAEKARQSAAAEAENEAAAQAARSTLSRTDFLQATRLVAEDNAADAVAYLVRSLEANPTNDAALTRLATLLMYRTWMLPTLVVTNTSAINAVEFSSDGTRLVTAGADGNVRLWDARTGQPQGPPIKHPASVDAARFSADGRRIVTAWGEMIRVWDVQTGQPLTGPLSDGVGAPGMPPGPAGAPPAPPSPMAPDRRASVVQFSLAGDRVLALTRDRRVRVWEVGSGKLANGPWQHTNGIMSAEFSLDGKRLETSLGNNLFLEWDVATGQPLGEPVSRTNRVDAAQLSPDRRRKLAVTNRRVRVLDAQTSQPLTEPMPHDADVSLARFSPDGQRVVTACKDQTIRIWDAQTEPARHLLSPLWSSYDPSSRDHPRTEFSPDGRRIVMPAGSDRVFVWDAQTGEQLAHLTNRNRVNAVRFSPDGSRIVTADGFKTSREASPDHTARVWDARTGQPQGEPMKHDSMIFSARFSSDGKRIVTASADQTSRVWDAQTGQPITGPLKHGNALTLAEFSLDGNRVLTLSLGRGRSATARLWNAQTGQPLNEPVTFDEAWKDMVLPSSPDGERILTPGNGMVRVWDALTGRPLTSPMVYGPPSTNASLYTSGLSSAEFSPDRKRIFMVSNQKHGHRLPADARVWDAQTGELLIEQLAMGAPGVDYARLTPDGKRIITAVGDKARVWDAQTGQPVTDPMSTGGRANEGGLEVVASSDGRRIVTLQSGRNAYLWDIAPAPGNAPVWLPQLAEVISGKVVNKQGTLETTRLNRTGTLNLIRQNLAAQPEDDWVGWGRWLLADRATRTTSPLAKVTIPEQITRNFEGKVHPTTIANLEEVLQLSPTNAVAFARLALLVKHPDPRNFQPTPDVAETYAQFAVKLAHNSGESWHALGTVYFVQGRPAAALAAVDRALELQPGNAGAWEIRGELLERTNRLAEALAAFTRQVELQPATTNQEPAVQRIARLHRARVLRKLDRLEEAAREISLAYGIPSRDAQAPPTLIELSAFYNAGLQGNWYQEQADNDLAALPIGVQVFAGTQFDVRGLIQLRGRSSATGTFPAQLTGLPVRQKVRRMHFLHGAIHGSDASGTEVGKYALLYADGTSQERPLMLGKDVLDWWAKAPENAGQDGLTVAWSGPNGRSRPRGLTVQLYKSTWENPRPEVEISHLDMSSTQKSTAPFLVAVTVE